MTLHASIMRDMVEILNTVKSIQNVQFGNHKPLDQERSWSSVYIIPGADTFSPRVLNTTIAGYDNSFFVRCLVNVNNDQDSTEWCTVRDDIIQAVLKDSELWTHIVDRDVVNVIYDDMTSFPALTMEIVFEFRIRETCT